MLKDIIAKQLKDYAYIDSQFIKENKIPTKTIARMVQKQKIYKIRKGLYATHPDFVYDEYAYITKRKSKVVFSGFSALLLLHQTEFMPAKIQVTIPNNYCFKDDSLEITRQKPELWKEGIIEVNSFNGEKVKCYSYERVIIDFIRKKQLNGEFEFKAIGNYNHYPHKNEKELYRLAKVFNVTEAVDQILNIMEYTRK